MDQGSEHTDPRAARRDPVANVGGFTDLATSPFRIDRDRIAASPFFARLGGVTQVVSAGGAGLLHNRLTHSLKVAQVARAIAERITTGDDAELADKLGGCDPDVAEAAALAHDLGHPPFGHLGEQTLDRIARHRFGLADGFEGNAQSFRIITTTDVRGPSAIGLDLTTAVRAAVLKYPWLRLHHPAPHPSEMAVPPRGAAEPDELPGTGAAKFSAYATELDDFEQARAAFAGRVESWQQTVEASVMDTADDIAYAIHDLQDFHRIGVLQHAPVAAELGEWLEHAGELAALDDETLHAGLRRPGRSLERLRRRMHAKDAWVVDDDAFAAAVARVRAELVDGLLAEEFDGSIEAEQATAAFSANWTARLVDGVVVVASPSTRSGHVSLRPAQWHEVAGAEVRAPPVRAAAARSGAAPARPGRGGVEPGRRAGRVAPRPRRGLPAAAPAARPGRAGAQGVLGPGAVGAGAAGRRDGEPVTGADAVRGLARGRAVVDFVASLTDKQAVTLLDALSGRAAQPWSDSFVL